MAKKNEHGAWIDAIFEACGKRYVSLETTSGTRREGKLTGLRNKTVRFNKQEREIVVSLELNGDPTDIVDFADLASIDIT